MTLQTGRRHFRHRFAVAVSSRAEAVDALRAAQIGPERSPGQPSVVLMFPGQGSQRVGMARHLYRHQPVFRQVMAECARTLEPELGVDVRDSIFADETSQAARRTLQRTLYTQPALFCIELALAEQLADLGSAGVGGARPQPGRAGRRLCRRRDQS